MIDVVVVDDHDIVRAGVSRLLEDTGDIRVVGQASNGEEAIAIVRSRHPQVVLMDVRMPGIGGLEATKRLLRSQPGVKIIVLTVCVDDPFPSKLLQAGAAGYLTKGSDVSEMVEAIKAVCGGKKYISTDIAQQLALKTVAESNESPLELLSGRELQVMMMIAKGEKVRGIASKLHLSEKTVNSYRYRIFEKLEVTSDVELAHFAIRHKVIDMEKS